MFHSKKLYNKNNVLHFVYNDKCSIFYQLLEKDKSVTINIGVLPAINAKFLSYVTMLLAVLEVNKF